MSATDSVEKQLLNIYREQKNERMIITDRFHKDVRKYCRPRRTTSISEGTTLEQKNVTGLWDPIGVSLSKDLANYLANALTPRNVVWHGMKISRESPAYFLRDDEEVRRWLDEYSLSVFRSMGESGFYEANNESLHDYCSFATSNIFSDRFVTPTGVKYGYQAKSIGSYTFGVDQFGIPNSHFMDWEVTARQAAQLFDTPTKEMVKAIQDGELEKKFKITRATVPTEDFGKVTPLKDFEYVFYDIAQDGEDTVRKRGLHEMPHAIGVFDKEADEKYGLGFAFVAMPSIKMANFYAKKMAHATSKDVEPPWAFSKRPTMGRPNMQAKGVVILDNPGDAKPLYTGAKMDQAQYMYEQSILGARSIYLADKVFLKETVQPRTAEEIATLRKQAEAFLGAPVGGYESQVLKKCVMDHARRMARDGKAPEAPEILKQFGEDLILEIEFLGQLSKSQKLQSIEAFDRVFSASAEWAAADPSILDVFDFEKEARHRADLLGSNPDSLRSEDAVKKIRERKAQLAAEEKEKEDVLVGAEAIGKAAPAIQAAGQ